MSRHDVFLLFACAIAIAVMAGSPAPLTRSAPITLAFGPTPVGVNR